MGGLLTILYNPGPTLLFPPSTKTWHAVHFLATFSPSIILAFSKRLIIGSITDASFTRVFLVSTLATSIGYAFFSKVFELTRKLPTLLNPIINNPAHKTPAAILLNFKGSMLTPLYQNKV